MHQTSQLPLVLAALTLSLTAIADDGLLPSEITVLINHSINSNPSADRKSITTPLVPRMRTNDLSEIEHFMKGEVHFLHLQPEKSRDEYWEFRNRDDNLGRVASQRLMVIRINAFGMVDELIGRDIPRYQERFGVRSDDRFGISFPIQRVAERLAERGDIDQTLDLIVSHVRDHDQFDSPYSAYALPGQFYALAARNSRADEFRELNEWVLVGINAAIDERLKTAAVDDRKAAEVPGAVFSSLFADQSLTYHEWTAEFMILRDRIAAGIATARDQ